MELEQENKENKKETQRCRQLTQRILRELPPAVCRWQVAGECWHRSWNTPVRC